MYRFLLLIQLFLFSALACPTSFTQCSDKYHDSVIEHNNTLLIPLNKTTSLLYTPTVPNLAYIKSNRLLGLYLLKDQNNTYPYIFTLKTSDKLVSLSSQHLKELKLKSPQIGLDKFAYYQGANSLGILNDSCCTLHGIATSKGVIDKSYLEQFVESSESRYADAGIRVKNSSGKVIVRAVDPYFKHGVFKLGDEILYMDRKRVSSASELMRDILFSKVGTTHYFRVQRAGRNLPLKLTFTQRFGGGLLSDTFLERFGFYFDDDLVVTQSAQKLKVGDKIISINKKKIENMSMFRTEVMNTPYNITLLVERHGFQFFIELNEDKK